MNGYTNRTMRLALALLLALPLQAQWDLQTSHTTASLRGIHALGHGVAWASGTEGTVLRTTDDGLSWQRCPTPPAAEHLDFRGIQAFDANTALVMSSGKGDLSRLYKTTDACQSWKLVFTNPDKDGFWDAVRFSDVSVPNPTPNYGAGVLVGDPVNGKFVIYTSYDKGDTWVQWTQDGNEPAQAIHPAKALKGESLFAASNAAAVIPGTNSPFAFVTGGITGSRLFVPEIHSPFDNGNTFRFRAKKLPIPHGATSGAFAMSRRPDANSTYADFMIVGGDYSKPEEVGSAVFVPGVPRLFLGVPPITQAQTPPHGYRSAVAYFPDAKAWITVGPNGTDLSTDDGRNWRALKPGPTEPPDADRNWNALSLPFVVGPQGRIGRLRPDALPTPAK